MKVEFDVQLKKQDVFRFNMYHSYHRFQTWFFTVLGVVITFLGFTTFDEVELMYTMMYILCGLIFVFYTPLNLHTASKLAMKKGNPLSAKLHYTFSEAGVGVSYADDRPETEEEEMERASTQMVDWKQLYRIVETGRYVFIYTSRVNASILPKEQIGEQLVLLKELMTQEVSSYRLKLKKN